MLDGLIPRLLLKLGACHSPFVQPGTPTVEVCAVCRQGFKDLRSCSHHAFKRHGRIRPERRLADGCQCPVCLKTCAANGRLCNHLRHNRSCRDALAGAAWHLKAAEYMLRIDLVDWIAPDVVAGVASTSTFRDASTVLPWS